MMSQRQSVPRFFEPSNVRFPPRLSISKEAVATSLADDVGRTTGKAFVNRSRP